MTTTTSNQAAYLMGKQQKPLEVSSAPLPTPGPNEVLIRVRAIAINPVDAAIQNMGIIWDAFPAILGSDLAGEITALGSAVQNFRVGDRVCACVESAAFQHVVAADVTLVARIPDHLPFARAAVLPLCLTTAASSLYEHANMGLRHPGQMSGGQKVPPNGQVVLVWGGASGVGSCAIQLLCAAGYEVAATASAANAAYCRDLGAAHVFDYKSPKVVEEIVEALQAKASAGVFSAIMSNDVIRDCATIADRLGGAKVVGTVAPSVMPFDVHLPEGVRLGVCNSTADILPNSMIKAKMSWPGMDGPSEVPPAVWDSWLAEALENGTMRCKPDPVIVGQGLGKIQEALDLHTKGVSAAKIVVEI